MGGGPNTPPESTWTHLSSRSSDDLVEVYNDVTDSSSAPAIATGMSNLSLDPLSAAPSSSFDTASPVPESDQGQLAELLWSKSAVYLHPTPYAKDKLAGFFSVVRVREGRDESHPQWKHLISWIPEQMVQGTSDFDAYVLVELSSQNERDILVHLAPPMPPTMTTPTSLSSSSASMHAFSHPITSIYSLQVHPPTLASWIGTITVSLFGGVSLPTLHFHDEESKSTVLDQDRRARALGVGGGRGRSQGPMPLAPSWGGEAFLSQIKAQARVIRSELDPTVYLVNPSGIDLEAHTFGKAYSDDAVPNEALRGLRGRIGEGQRGVRQRDQAKTSILHQSSPVSSPPKAAGDWPDDLSAAVRSDSSSSGGMDNLTFSVLSGFSRITRSAKNISQQAASTVLSHPLAKPLAKHVPKPIAQFAFAPGEIASLAESAGVGVYDGARVYLAKWARIVAEEGERARKAEYGVDDSSLLEDEMGETGVFEILSKTYHIAKPRTTRAPRTPISLEEWRAWFNPATGQLLVSEPEAKRRIFQRGMADDDCRKEVWPFLLGVYGWETTQEERKAVAEEKSTFYEQAKRSWMDNEELHATERYQEEDHRVDIDCRRTDRTHPMFATPEPIPGAPPEQGDGRAHPPSTPHVRATHDVLMTWVFAADSAASDVVEPSGSTAADPVASPRAYVQGMSDLFSPLYVVLDGEQWLAYSCFETVMERNSDNFRMDQLGMKKQLSELQSLIRVMDRGLYRHFEQTNSLNLFFAYRWLLTCYKREFSFEDTVKLWEVLFTDHLGTKFHLFFALAILEANREVMIRYLREFDEILKYTVELSGTLDLQTLVSDAEVLYLTFKQIVTNASSSETDSAPTGDVRGGEGLRKRRVNGQFPPTEEDKEEAKRDKIRERTQREVEELKELLE
ncbi:GTPase-activating protein GYP7 [Sporobolomyces koalae]|uniref:GTPase-activating protein GYP7 n=1 Tax=Sporobolomyces koalae TaxID=500713 RepID=UPI0031799E5C